MPPWNAAGTRVSSASVTEAGSVSVRWPAVPFTSRDASSRPSESSSEGPPSRSRQKAISEASAASRARAESRCAQCRNDVPRARQRHRAAARHRLPRRRKVGPENPPRHSVHRKMVDRQQQAAGARGTRVEPHRLHQMPRRRIEPKLGCLRLPMDQRAQLVFVETARIHPTQARLRPHRAHGQHLERPVLRPGVCGLAVRRHRAAAAARRDGPAAPAAPPRDPPAAGPRASAAAATG